ncbi:hypothetical protein GIB67_019208 [Kingdonia uniflora]|uniref:LysM domain-containing protein n=1 Tax=Kingdonia uniflora TaxID=39325 RepID=A0A7J7MZQ9_9MAGN|nr:hypothetical protein GIB67_019208 [Kingdonia uniflora]
MASNSTMRSISTTLAIFDAVSWLFALVLVTFILVASFKDNSFTDEPDAVRRNHLFINRPCDEIYVVTEGETLHTISVKCGDPYIVEENPHIHDLDDVFPGLVIKIDPSTPRKLLKFA